MNPRIFLYAFSSFFLTFASGARDGLTTAGWVSLVAFCFGSAATAAIAYLDRSSGQPPQPLSGLRTTIAIIAIAAALTLAGCAVFEVSTRLTNGTTIRAGSDGRAATLSLSRDF